MRSSADIASKIQYAALLALSLVALYLWKSGLQDASQEAINSSSAPVSRAAKQTQVVTVDLDKLKPKKVRKFEKLYCPKLEPVIKHVTDYIMQDCECGDQDATFNSKNTDIRSKLLAKRKDKDSLGETEALAKKEEEESEAITKDGCMKLLAMKVIFKQKKEDKKFAKKNADTIKVVVDRKVIERDGLKKENLALRARVDALQEAVTTCKNKQASLV